MTDKKVFKICLTGGPCAGKTTALSRIVETFAPEFTVYTLPEVATMTFSSGVTILPDTFTEESHKKFTQSICQMQIHIENYFETIASLQNKKVLIVTDRGVCDNFAYCSPENKQKIMQEANWSMNFLCNERYDMVLHMVTAAQGASEFYTLENNSARWETKELAVHFDEKGRKEWMSHPNFVIVDNSRYGFEQKIQRVLKSVGNLIGAKSTHKCIKKYLLEPGFDLEMIPSEIKCDNYTQVCNFLLTNNPNIKTCIFKRMYRNQSQPSYIYTSQLLSDKYEKRIETHKILTEKFYLDFLSQVDPGYATVHKEVVCFLLSNQREINIYNVETVTLKGEKLFILKVIRDCEHEEISAFPSFLKVLEDITENPKYYSMNFALNRD